MAVLPKIYRTLLRLTRRHGLFTLARNHCRLFRQGQIVRLPLGGDLFIPPDPHFFGFLTGLHEEHISRLLVECVPAGATCIDVGANIGYFTALMASRAGSSGQIYSFEPVPENFLLLKANAELNSSRFGAQISVINAAVSDEPGELRIERGAESTLHSVQKVVVPVPGTELIPAVTLDSLISSLNGREISILKIDVEGHEGPVVRGAAELLSGKRVKNLIIEVTPGKDALELAETLGEFETEVRVWSDRAWRRIPVDRISARTDVWARF